MRGACSEGAVQGGGVFGFSEVGVQDVVDANCKVSIVAVRSGQARSGRHRKGSPRDALDDKEASHARQGAEGGRHHLAVWNYSWNNGRE